MRSLIIGVVGCVFGWVVFALVDNYRFADIDRNVGRHGAFSAAAARSVSIGLEAPKSDISGLAPLLRGYNRTKYLSVQASWVSDSELIALIGIDSIVKLRIIRKHVSRDVLQAICDRIKDWESVYLYAASFDPGSEELLESIKSGPLNQVILINPDFDF